MRRHYDTELDAIRSKILGLGAQVSAAAGHAAHALASRDLQEALDVRRDDRDTDALRYAVETACLNVMATQQPMARDLRRILGAAFIAVELERCGDYAKGIARAARRIVREVTDDGEVFNLNEMAAAARGMLDQSMAAYAEGDLDAARAVVAEDETLDGLYDALLKAAVARMSADPEFAERGTWLLHAGHCLERIGDRATNIAERVIFIVTGALPGDLNTHRTDRARTLT